MDLHLLNHIMFKGFLLKRKLHLNWRQDSDLYLVQIPYAKRCKGQFFGVGQLKIEGHFKSAKCLISVLYIIMD